MFLFSPLWNLSSDRIIKSFDNSVFNLFNWVSVSHSVVLEAHQPKEL